MNTEYETLLSHAFTAMKHAYAPYSHYHVGSCVETWDGHFILGANVENAAYGSTNCAERNSIFSAYSQGYRKDDIKAIAIVSDGDRIATPCGACRQVLSELLHGDTPVVLSNGKDISILNMETLLPFAFGTDDLKK